MSLENLEKKLYQMDSTQDDQTIDLSGNQKSAQTENNSEKKIQAETTADQVSGEWKDNIDDAIKNQQINKTIEKVGFATKAIFWILLAAVLIAGGFLYYYFSQYLKNKDLGFEINAPQKVMIAEPFDINVTLENKSQATMRQAKIIVQLPDGIINASGDPNKHSIEEAIDDLDPGTVSRNSFKLVALKDPQSIKKIEADFSYLPQNINTRFERSEESEVAVDQSVIDLNLVAPQKVFNREMMEINVKYHNVSQNDISGLKIKLIYPQGFTFKESSTSTASGNDTWNIDQVPKDKEDSINIKGTLEGPDQANFDVKAQAILVFNGVENVINEKSATLNIASSPLSLSIAAGDSNNFVALTGKGIRYVLNYQNNTDVALHDVIIKANLKGEMFDFRNIQTKGFYNSSDNSILWNAGNSPELKLINPGTSGSVEFFVNTKAYYPINRMFDKNFTLKVNAEINSPTVPNNVASDKTVGYANSEVKVAGNTVLNIQASLLKKDKVRKTYTYNIHWAISNYSNDVKDVVVKSLLTPGIHWLNVVKSNIDTVPSYNERTNEIAWQIGKIIATKGVIGDPVTADFQVELPQSIIQSSQTSFYLTDQSSLSATDEFTGLPINQTIASLRIELSK